MKYIYVFLLHVLIKMESLNLNVIYLGFVRIFISDLKVIYLGSSRREIKVLFSTKYF